MQSTLNTGPNFRDHLYVPPRLPLAHALSTRQPNLPIQIHSENPPTLPVARKGKGGRLLRRPQQAHLAATVADFRTGVLRREENLVINSVGSRFQSVICACRATQSR
jgi:hypothetical protein